MASQRRAAASLELPGHLQSLFDDFKGLDKVWCFFKSRKLSCNAHAVVRAAKLSLERVRLMQEVAPTTIRLQWHSSIADDADDLYHQNQQNHTAKTFLELWLSGKAAASKGSIAKRTEAFRQALMKLCFASIDTCTTITERDRQDYEKRTIIKAWPVGFDPTSTPLPDMADMPPEPVANQSTTRRTKAKDYINYTGQAQPPRTGPFDPQATLDALLKLPLAKGQVVHVERIPPRAPSYSQLAKPLPEALHNTLATLGITQLYTHQVEAINASRAGRNVIISTATSSGKSLVYQLPVMERLLESPSSNLALYMFPTKALAQDQLRSLTHFVGAGWLGDAVHACTLDADTGKEDRRFALQLANILLTNPDMLHVTLLPNHARWCRVFRNLRYVILDEAHTYRGVFGSHVACVMRRLLRVCHHYDNLHVQFICCSATLANPEHHFRQLVPLYGMAQRQLSVVTTDGSPSGERLFALWNPTLDRAAVEEGEQQPKTRSDRSSTSENACKQGSTNNTRAHVRGLGRADKARRLQLSTLLGDSEHAPTNANEEGTDTDTTLLQVESLMQQGLCAGIPPPVIVVPVEEGPLPKPTLTATRAGSIPSVPAPQPAGTALPTASQLQMDVSNDLIAQPLPQPSSLKPPTAKRTSVTSPKRSPRKVKVVAFKEQDTKITSPILETALLLSALTKLQAKTLAFCKHRKVSELVLKYTRRDLKLTATHLESKVQAYRAGYTREVRRELERKLFTGELLATTATCALELGVDIGSLDTTLLLGFPGSIASMWQQAGRSGRGTNKALSIIVLFNSPLDQYYAKHATELFSKGSEAAVSDPDNPYVLREHLACAAKELPLLLRQEDVDVLKDYFSSQGQLLASEADVVRHARNDAVSLPTTLQAQWQDLLLFGDTAGSLCYNLVTDGVLKVTESGYALAYADVQPAASVSIRTMDDDNVTVLALPDLKKIDEVDMRHALWEVYQGAIFLHRGQTYLITQLDLSDKVAHAQPVTVDYFTKPLDTSDVDVIGVLKQQLNGVPVFWGNVSVSVNMYGYRKVRERSFQVFDMVTLEMPPVEYKTRGVWFDVPVHAKEQILEQNLDIFGSLHGANHAIRNSTPLNVLCDPLDIDCEHYNALQERPRPFRLVLHDTKPGGIGICYAIHELVDLTVESARNMVRDCACREGCPSCVQDWHCGEYNERIDKRGALLILEALAASIPATTAARRRLP
eukprot:m.138134 g.138134  ORF g.138134 m.138134 type:complete len:1212 (-) comp16065_c0_seq4:135-3770(-)